MRPDILRQIFYFAIYVLLQLPVLYRLVLFDSAFGFFYVGFILFLPRLQNRMTSLLLAFLSGLLVDIFSNTLGIHALASTLIAYVRIPWLVFTRGVDDDDAPISVFALGLSGLLLYVIPLIFLHHSVIFLVEHGSFSLFGTTLKRIVLSTLFTSTLLVTTNYLLATKRRRL
ncbi:MAG: Rod shape-determining protein MreD [Bacteroidota bacterium]